MEARERELALQERKLAEAKETRERETALKEREMAGAKEARERETVLKEREMAEAKEALNASYKSYKYNKALRKRNMYLKWKG